jgi:hypothetical protein
MTSPNAPQPAGLEPAAPVVSRRAQLVKPRIPARCHRWCRMVVSRRTAGGVDRHFDDHDPVGHQRSRRDVLPELCTRQATNKAPTFTVGMPTATDGSFRTATLDADNRHYVKLHPRSAFPRYSDGTAYLPGRRNYRQRSSPVRRGTSKTVTSVDRYDCQGGMDTPEIILVAGNQWDAE